MTASFSSNYGLYLDFPPVGHYIRRLKKTIEQDEFRKRIIESILALKNYHDVIKSSSAGDTEIHNINRYFELGIADGYDFLFLDNNEEKRFTDWLMNNTRVFLDLVIFVHYRYHVKDTNKIASLRFDQYFLRIGFRGSVFTFSHVKGLNRTTPEELLSLLMKNFPNNEILNDKTN